MVHTYFYIYQIPQFYSQILPFAIISEHNHVIFLSNIIIDNRGLSVLQYLLTPYLNHSQLHVYHLSKTSSTSILQRIQERLHLPHLLYNAQWSTCTMRLSQKGIGHLILAVGIMTLPRWVLLHDQSSFWRF